MNRDRGVIKWTAMMLPEHVQKLKTLQNEQKQLSPREWDEQTFQEWDQLLSNAYHHKLSISLTIQTEEARLAKEHISGTILRIDSPQQIIYLSCDMTASTVPVTISSITDFTLNDKRDDFIDNKHSS